MIKHPNSGAVLVLGLGCTQKGGSAKIVDVLKYGEVI